VILAVVAGDGFATVSFAAGAAQGSAIKEFKVQAIASGTVVRTVSGIPASQTSAEVDGLDNGTSYKFKVLAVNKLGLSSDPSTPSTAVVPKPPAPSVVGSTPAGGADSVGVDDSLTVTFDKSVSSADFAGATTLRNNVSSSVLAASVSYDDATRTLTVDPAARLAEGTSYTLTLSGAGANGIRDSFGTPLPTTAITFTTVPDRTAPTVTSVSPLRGATGVKVKTNVVVRFSERMTGISTLTAVLVNRKTGRTVKTFVTVNTAGTRLTIDPRVDLARNTGYRLTLTGGASAIRDAAGNPLVTLTTRFRTRP
jgi:Big-like domain-containing protein/fibronectin type III domain protein